MKCYVIVEAKGPDQQLTDDPFRPSFCRKQMSEGWILNNLAHMDKVGHGIAGAVLRDVGLKLNIREKGDKAPPRATTVSYRRTGTRR